MLNDGRSAKVIQCFHPNSNVLHTLSLQKSFQYIYSAGLGT